MPDLICLSSLHKFSRKLWRQLMKKWRKEKRRRREGRRLVLSGFNTLASAIESSSSQFRQVFQFMDANGDGKISPLELREVLLRLGHQKAMAAAEAERMVREMDCDGDGLVDEEEFMKIVAVKAGGEIGNGHDDDEEDGVMDAFNVFDADKDGLISAKELQRVLVSLGWEKCSLGECREMIKGVDRDGDGFVDFEEFKWMMMAGSKS